MSPAGKYRSASETDIHSSEIAASLTSLSLILSAAPWQKHSTVIRTSGRERGGGEVLWGWMVTGNMSRTFAVSRQTQAERDSDDWSSVSAASCRRKTLTCQYVVGASSADSGSTRTCSLAPSCLRCQGGWEDPRLIAGMSALEPEAGRPSDAAQVR